MSLCSYCKNIPEYFFDPVPERFFGPADKTFLYLHNTLNGIRQAAVDGCPMCWTMVQRLDDSFVPEDMKNSERVHMKRAIIDPEQGFGLFMGIDDMSHNIFHVVPHSLTSTLPVARINESVDEVSLMRHWISDCINNHAKCAKAKKIFCPKRLLDLNWFYKSDDIVLKELDSNKPIVYTTLSHCWGAKKNSMTTTIDTLKARTSRILFTELPLSFQHAVIVTRQLDIPYLWIDSLCIIQDLEKDWEQQVKVMGQIYGNSTCTLAALDSKDSSGGFPLSRGPREGFDLPIGQKRVRVFISEPNSWGSSMTGPLLERAWTLQERVLSMRTLHFSHHDLLWECKTAKASTELPWLQAKAYDADEPPKLLCDSFEEAETLATGVQIYPMTLRQRWFGTIENYSQRRLTFSKDKLPAVSGLAHNFADEWHHWIRAGYAAGIWEKDMPSALLWMAVHQDSPNDSNLLPRRPPEYRAPTWSWPSLDGEISYESQFVDAEQPNERDPAEYDLDYLTIITVYSLTGDTDKMGLVSGGHIIAKGYLREAIVGQEPPEYEGLSYKVFRYMFLLGSDKCNVGILLPDVWSEVHSGQSVHCLYIRHERYYSSMEMPYELHAQRPTEADDSNPYLGMGLALVKLQGCDTRYARVGLVRWMKKACFDFDLPSEITIF